jgi:hypothetical protein
MTPTLHKDCTTIIDELLEAKNGTDRLNDPTEVNQL